MCPKDFSPGLYVIIAVNSLSLLQGFDCSLVFLYWQHMTCVHCLEVFGFFGLQISTSVQKKKIPQTRERFPSPSHISTVCVHFIFCFIFTRPLADVPHILKCSCDEPRMRLGEPLASDIILSVTDKHGNKTGKVRRFTKHDYLLKRKRDLYSYSILGCYVRNSGFSLSV